ncbi:MAG: sensor histidine kinase [Terriglobales bacterium]
MIHGNENEARRPNSSRRRRVWALSALLVVLIVVLFWPQAFSLRFQPSPEHTWLLFLLSTLCFLGIVVLVFVLGRQMVKLYDERRAQVLGARFKTKLVLGALALSLTPVVCMFGFTYGLINRTLDKWFSQPVETVRDDNAGMLHLLASFVSRNAQDEANSLAANPALRTALTAGNWDAARAALRQHRTTLEGGFALVVNPAGLILASYGLPPGYGPSARGGGGQLRLGSTSYALSEQALAGTPGFGDAQVEVGMPLPEALTAQIAQLRRDRDRYDRLAHERRSLRLIYTGYLLLLTLAILFGATWLALALSKLVTVPMGALAAATQELGRGNLAYRVQVGAGDEIGVVVDSFNRMAVELEANRSQLEMSRQELETRRRYTEALLENTPSAVISLDRQLKIERVSPALARLYGPELSRPATLAELFDGASLREVHHLLRRAERLPAASAQIEVNAGGRALTLAATAAAIAEPSPTSGSRRAWSGYVLVLEDLTDMLRIQKTAAWREVAQRIAHEIKNPLTPIALSAQRIRRRLGETGSGDQAVIAECAATIESEVHSLERLVNEFSAFARFPHAQRVTCDLNEIVERALRAFDGRLDGIEIRTHLEPLPPLRLDPEDMKRVFINLIDNAAEALQGSPYRQITLATQTADGTVEAIVADTGPGLPAGDKQRLFLPYYSTKQRGSGLGLAIVLRIVEENGGTLRAEDNAPLGARFVIELPVAAAETVAAPATLS